MSLRELPSVRNAIPGELMLETREVADVLRVGPTKVKALMKTGELPSVKIGGSRRVRWSDLREYVENLPNAPVSSALIPSARAGSSQS